MTDQNQTKDPDEDLGDLAPDTDSSLDAAEDEKPEPGDPSTDNEPEGTPPGDGDDEAGEDAPVEVQP